jgi:hypothetical protein
MTRAIVACLLLGMPMLLSQSISHEENATAMSDRAQAGLRGPVKSSTEESAYPELTDATGKALEVRFERTTEYDPEGRILSTRNRNSDGSQWVFRKEYSKSGQLLKTVSGTEGHAQSETLYSYDAKGRLDKMTTSNTNEPPVMFRYDENGRKTEVVSVRASDYRPNVAVGGSPFDAASVVPNLPDGGTVSTIYDEHDRATEIQVRGTNGELVNRALRTYDAQGHIIEEKQIHDNLMSMLPPEARQKMLDESGLSAEQLGQELNAQLATLMKGRTEIYTISYRYDSRGHLIHTSRRIFDQEDEIETTCNERGDVELEITRSARSEAETEHQGPEPPSSYSETRYSYQYDPAGNWTQKTVVVRSSPEGEFQTSTVIKRSLTYY